MLPSLRGAALACSVCGRSALRPLRCRAGALRLLGLSLCVDGALPPLASGRYFPLAVSDAFNAWFPSLWSPCWRSLLLCQARPPKPQASVAPVRCGLPAVAVVLSLSVGVCVSRPVVMVGALVRLSVVSLLVVCLLPLLVRLSASRCVWLRRAAPGPARLVLFLVWLLSLVSVLPGRVWACPSRLLVVVLSLLVLVSLLVAPSFVRARVGPSARLQGGASMACLLVLCVLVCRLLRRRR